MGFRKKKKKKIKKQNSLEKYYDNWESINKTLEDLSRNALPFIFKTIKEISTNVIHLNESVNSTKKSNQNINNIISKMKSTALNLKIAKENVNSTKKTIKNNENFELPN